MGNQEWTIKNGQSRMGIQEWTIKNGLSRMDNPVNWQHWVHKTQNKDKQNIKYNTENYEKKRRR